MASFPNAPTILIAVVVSNVGREFLNLISVLSTEKRFASQVLPTSVQDEFTRFKMWAGNIAAHRRGRRSLEYRLRDAEQLKSEVHNLLDALAVALHKALAIVRGETIPWDAYEVSDSDTDSDISEVNLQGDTELKQLIASIRTTVTSLFRLSMAIRDPAPTSQSASIISIDKSYFEHHDILHVQAKYPSCAKYLADRLGRAISRRRQYLSYREEHHQKLAKNVEEIGLEESRTEHTNNSTEATPIPSIHQQKSLDAVDDNDSASQTSFAISINAAIRVPALPKSAQSQEFFECPLCFMIVSIHNKTAWRQHIYRDLHPYCCTFSDCTTADRLYDSRHEWFQHEVEAHRTSWQCIETCEKSFATTDDLSDHVHKSHPDLVRMLPAIKRTSAKHANMTEQAQCPLCEKSMSLRGLQKHLAAHQQQLALFALPSNLDETENVGSADEDKPAGVGEHDDEDVPSASDASDGGTRDEDVRFQNDRSMKEGGDKILKTLDEYEPRLTQHEVLSETRQDGVIGLKINKELANASVRKRVLKPIDPSVTDDFADFKFKNLAVLEKAGRDAIEKLRAQEKSKSNSQSATSSSPSLISHDILPPRLNSPRDSIAEPQQTGLLQNSRALPEDASRGIDQEDESKSLGELNKHMTTNDEGSVHLSPMSRYAGQGTDRPGPSEWQEELIIDAPARFPHQGRKTDTVHAAQLAHTDQNSPSGVARPLTIDTKILHNTEAEQAGLSKSKGKGIKNQSREHDNIKDSLKVAVQHEEPVEEAFQMPKGPSTDSYIVQRRPTDVSGSVRDRVRKPEIIIEIGSKKDKSKKYPSGSYRSSRRVYASADSSVGHPDTRSSHAIRNHMDGSHDINRSRTPSLHVTSDSDPDPDEELSTIMRNTRLRPVVHNIPTKSSGTTVVAPQSYSGSHTSHGTSYLERDDLADRSESPDSTSTTSARVQRGTKYSQVPGDSRDKGRRKEKSYPKVVDAVASRADTKHARDEEEYRAGIRAEMLLLEKEQRRAADREEARRRRSQVLEDRTSDERKQESPKISIKRPASNNERPRGSRRLSMTQNQLEEQRRLLKADLMEEERREAEYREREEMAALGRQQQQSLKYYNPRRDEISPPTPTVTRRPSVSRRTSIQPSISDQSNSNRRPSIVQPNPRHINIRDSPMPTTTRPPNTRRHTPPSASFPAELNTRPTSARRSSISRSENTSPQNPFAVEAAAHAPLVAIQDPWDSRNLQYTLPTRHQDPWDSRNLQSTSPSMQRPSDNYYTTSPQSGTFIESADQTAARRATQAMRPFQEGEYDSDDVKHDLRRRRRRQS